MIQLEMIERVRLQANESAAITSVLMYGSFAKGEGDAYSDIEFYVFIKPEQPFDSRVWINSIRDTALYYTNEFGTEVAIFDNLVRGEFHFMKVDEIGIIRSWEGLVSFEWWENMILVDKEGKLADELREIRKSPPERGTAEGILWLQQSFINNALFTKNLLLRQEWAHAQQQLGYLHKYLLWLIRIRVGSTAHWESPTKKAEADLPGDWYRRYASCTAALHPENLDTAFRECLDLAAELFSYFGAPENIGQLLVRIKGKKP